MTAILEMIELVIRKLIQKAGARWAWGVALLPFSLWGNTYLSDGYAIKVWQSDDGLPRNSVTSAVQTRDGYLWVGTFGGLARFDGLSFKEFNSNNTPVMRDDRIVSLFEGEDGTLWIGHETGEVTYYRDQRFYAFEADRPASGESVKYLGSDRTGEVWAFRENGELESLSDGTVIPGLGAEQDPNVFSWTRSSDGRIWLTEEGEAAEFADGQLKPIAFDQTLVSNFVLSVAAAAEGGVWMLVDRKIRRWKDGDWVESLGSFPWDDGFMSCSLELADGTLAIGTIADGLYLIFPDGKPAVHLDREDGLPQDWVRFLYEDREGNLWLGAGGSGLVSIRKTALKFIASPDRQNASSVLSVETTEDGDLWVGTEGAGLFRLRQGEWTRFAEDEGLFNPYVWSVLESKKGTIWTGTWHSGPYHLRGDSFRLAEGINEGLGPILALTEGQEAESLLIGSREGLLQWKEGKTDWLYQAESEQPANVLAVEKDGEGGLWFAQSENGVIHQRNGVVERYGKAEGLGSNATRCLYLEKGSVWVGTTNGLSRIKEGKVVNISAEQGLISNVICHIEEDDWGNFWLSTYDGIQRIAKSDLNRFANGEIDSFDSLNYSRSDGLPTNEFTVGLQAAGAKDRDGRIWFTCSKGLVGVDPSRIQFNDTKPLVALESFIVDGAEKSLAKDEDVAVLQPNHQRLEFRFTGLSLAVPEKVRFRYRLDGIDGDWVESDGKRTAFYSRLSAGDYRFRVVASNNDGVWSETEASVSFEVAPFFYETWWFNGTVVVFSLLIVGSIVCIVWVRRIRIRMETLERQSALERERSRIARDIHDEVGSSLARISMLSQGATDDATGTEEDRQSRTLGRIYSTACEVTRVLDEIVWAVDPKHDTLDSLIGYMGKYAQDFLGMANIRCRLDLPFDLPAWRITAEVRHNLFLAFKEALSNVAKHSNASEVRVSLKLLNDSFVLTIVDDGDGFDLAQTMQGIASHARRGNGLRNFEKRLSTIGGTCEITTNPGAGTKVTFLAKADGIM